YVIDQSGCSQDRMLDDSQIDARRAAERTRPGPFGVTEGLDRIAADVKLKRHHYGKERPRVVEIRDLQRFITQAPVLRFELGDSGVERLFHLVSGTHRLIFAGKRQIETRQARGLSAREERDRIS